MTKAIKKEEVSKKSNKTPLETLVSEVLELNKGAVENVLNIKEKYINGQVSKEEVNNIERQYKVEVLPILKSKYETALTLGEDLTAEQYAILKGGVPFTPEIFTSSKFEDYAERLDNLRRDGEYHIATLQDAIKSLVLKKSIDKADKKEQIDLFKKDLVEARGIEKNNHDEVKKLTHIASELARIYGKELLKFYTLKNKFLIRKAEKERAIKLKEEKERFYNVKISTPKKNQQFVLMKHESIVNEIVRDTNEKISSYKDEINEAYIAKYNYYRHVRNNKLNVAQNLEHSARGYARAFTVKGFLLRNALYFVIIAFFLTCVIISAVQGHNLLNGDNIISILCQSSTKMFFSLGVAGLILLGGTDLSIGRMTGMVATFSCMFLSKAKWTTNFGVIDFSGWGSAGSIILGLLVCIVVATLFSSLAGFFTAKFKMHPFITTLSTQLLIFGLMMICFSQVSAFRMDDNIRIALTGGETGWKLIMFAAIAIAILWFIWNKTKFGRHMYAVGDNKEAAKVSGINVVGITIGVFVLAGICYGLGGFLEGAYTGSANPSYGLGTELDAIAACVIGGISFSGGRGKIRGAVVGTIIFTTLTYCLTYIGLDSNYQYIFKGIIILAAVCLDSLKFLEKK